MHTAARDWWAQINHFICNTVINAWPKPDRFTKCPPLTQFNWSLPFAWFMKSIIGFLYNSILHAIISTLLIIFTMNLTNLFALLKEINNNVIPHQSAVLISCNHSITRLISFTINGSNQRSILSVYGPSRSHSVSFSLCLTFYLSRWRYWAAHSPENGSHKAISPWRRGLRRDWEGAQQLLNQLSASTQV